MDVDGRLFLCMLLAMIAVGIYSSREFIKEKQTEIFGAIAIYGGVLIYGVLAFKIITLCDVVALWIAGGIVGSPKEFIKFTLVMLGINFWFIGTFITLIGIYEDRKKRFGLHG